MADISDVTAAIVQIAGAALYPPGQVLPNSVCGLQVNIFEGWPMPAQLDADIKAHMACVSVFPVPGTSSDPGQVMDFDPKIVVPAVHGMTAAVVNNAFLITGTPGAGEYATVILNGNLSWSYVRVAGDTAASVMAALAALILANVAGVTVGVPGVTIPGAISLVVRIGAPATAGEILHRQKQQMRVSIWAPDPASRTAIAKVVDVALKQQNIIALPDTSGLILNYYGTNIDDIPEKANIFRRDIIMSAQWDTLNTYQVYEITTVSNAISGAFTVNFTN